MIIYNQKEEREVHKMGGRADYKKVARTKFTGQSSKRNGSHWVEIVATKKQANKKFRKMA